MTAERDRKTRGFSLFEVVTYVAVLAVLIISISDAFFWIVKAKQKADALQGASINASIVMGTMVREIRAAKSIYLPDSVFDSSPGSLSLETTNYLPPGEQTTRLSFYICQEQFCFKKEGQDPLVLTSNEVKIKTLKFNRVVTGSAESVEISLEVSSNNPQNRPEKEADISLTTVASLRSY